MTRRAALAGAALLATLAALLPVVLVLVGCPRGKDAAQEPVAEPAPVDIDWPDAGPTDAAR